MTSQKYTPRLIYLFLFPLLILGCNLFQAKPQNTNEKWISYTTDLFTINIPKYYLGAKPGTDDVKVISGWMRKNGYDDKGFEAFVEANSSSLLFTAYNTNIGKSGGLTQITLAGGKKPSNFSLEEYVAFYIGTLTGDKYKLISHEQKTIGNKKVDFIVYDEQEGNSVFRDGVYIFETSSRFWKFEFYAPQAEFESQSSVFERIVLELKPVDAK